MAVLLSDYVASLKREVQPPGTDIFTGVSAAAWVGYLSDAFWEARLDGFMEGYTVQDEGTTDASIVPVGAAPELPRENLALVVLYAGIKILRNRILNTNTSFKAKAGPVEFEQQSSATMLAEMLKQLRATKDRIIAAIEAGDETDVLVLDAYSTRVLSPESYGGSIELTG